MEGKGLNIWKMGMLTYGEGHVFKRILIQGIILSVISKLDLVLFQVYLDLESINTSSGFVLQYFIDDTEPLWEKHCCREFKGTKPDRGQTWRELYMVNEFQLLSPLS